MNGLPILKCLIVDDELYARECIEKYVRKVPFLKLCGVSNNGMEGLSLIQQFNPDLIFLDIEMPEIDGFELLLLIQKFNPSIVVISGDPSYAVEGFNQQVSDFLLKPVAFDRFMRAVNKVIQERSISTSALSNSHLTEETASNENGKLEEKRGFNYLLVKEKKRHIRIDFEQIRFVEGMKDYLKVYWADQCCVLHLTMSKIEERLPKPNFIRVHRSFIINKDVIQEIDGNEVTLRGDKKIPIGVTYRNEVFERLKENLL